MAGTPDRVVKSIGGSGGGGDVNVTNFPADYPDVNALAALNAILAALGAPLDVNVLNATLDVLVQNFPADYPDANALAELQSILAQLQGTLAARLVTPAGDSAMDEANDAVRVNVVAGGAGGGAVTIADGDDVNSGSTTDAASTSDAGATLSSKLRGLVKWAYERMPSSLGQKLMAASFPVALASDQSPIDVSGSEISLSFTEDAGNSLAATQGDFTGTWFDTLGHDGVLVVWNITLDPGETGDFYLQWSPDGINVFAEELIDSGGSGGATTVLSGDIRRSHRGRYFRVAFVISSGTAPINIWTIHVPIPSPETFLPLHDSMVSPPSNPVVGFGMVWNGSGWDRVPGKAASGVRISPYSTDSNSTSDSLGDNFGLPFTEGGSPIAPWCINFMWNGTGWSRMRGDTTYGQDVDVTRMPAQMINGVLKDSAGNDCTVKTAFITHTSITETQLVAAVASRRIRVLSAQIANNAGTGTGRIDFKDGNGGTILWSGRLNNSEQLNLVPLAGTFLCQTSVNTALYWDQATTSETYVIIQYIEVA